MDPSITHLCIISLRLSSRPQAKRNPVHGSVAQLIISPVFSHCRLELCWVSWLLVKLTWLIITAIRCAHCRRPCSSLLKIDSSWRGNWVCPCRLADRFVWRGIMCRVVSSNSRRGDSLPALLFVFLVMARLLSCLSQESAPGKADAHTGRH